MDFNEAVQDKNRPLCVTPREWMYTVEAALEEEKQLVEESVDRLVEEKEIKKDEMSGFVKIDLGIDQIVQGIKIVYCGLSEVNKKDLSVKERGFYKKIKDLFDTAIVPYVSDVSKIIEDEENYTDKE